MVAWTKAPGLDYVRSRGPESFDLPRSRSSCGERGHRPRPPRCVGHVSVSVLVGGRCPVPSENGVELPLTRESPERVRTTILELQVGPRNDVPHGAGHEDLARSRVANHSGACVHRDPADLAVVSDALPGMEASSGLQSELGERNRDRGGASDRRCRRVEGREEPVAGVIDLVSTPSIEKIADPGVVGLQEQGPPAVTERCRQPSRADQVGEEQRDQDTELNPVRGGCAISLFVVHGGPSRPLLLGGTGDAAIAVELWGSAKLIEDIGLRSDANAGSGRSSLGKNEGRPEAALDVGWDRRLGVSPRETRREDNGVDAESPIHRSHLFSFGHHRGSTIVERCARRNGQSGGFLSLRRTFLSSSPSCVWGDVRSTAKGVGDLRREADETKELLRSLGSIDDEFG